MRTCTWALPAGPAPRPPPPPACRVQDGRGTLPREGTATQDRITVLQERLNHSTPLWKDRGLWWPGGATGQEGPELLGEEGSGGKVSVGKAGALNWRRSLGQIWVGWGPPQSPVGDRDWVGTGELCSWVSPQPPPCAPSLPTPQFSLQVLCTSSWFRAPSQGSAVPSGGEL